MQVDFDSFASGQILSKIWLCEELEPVVSQHFHAPVSIVLLGGWYGLINLLLRSRNRIDIRQVKNIDIDQQACDIADKINESWVWQSWQFKSFCQDACKFEYADTDIVVNTSVEHMQDTQWFDNIPKDTVCVLQSNNMTHEDHYRNHLNLDEFVDDFPLKDVYYAGIKNFQYPDWSFERYMIIGRK